jgi:hypothetical protein
MIRVDLRIRLKPAGQAQRYVYLRELSGYDELWDAAATALIDRLLVDYPGVAVRPGEALKLTLAEVDRVLATVYRSLYGDEVTCHVPCSACSGAYALSFTLTDMWAAVTEMSPEDEALLSKLDGPDEQGVYYLGPLGFRLPTGEDLAAVAGLEPEAMVKALQARCIVAQDPHWNEETFLDRLMSLVGPTLDTDLDGVCPRCGAEQAVPFRIDTFLLAALRRESALLTREVHELARTYHWSRREILEMPRRERRQYTGLVLAELTSDRDAWT